jgi:hypothetical protein
MRPVRYAPTNRKKAATAGPGQGAVTASPSTKPQMSPMWPRPKTYSHTKKAAAEGRDQRRLFDSTHTEDAQLWEISENFIELSLSALDRDEQIAMWVALVERRRITAQPEQKRRGRPEGGEANAERDLQKKVTAGS